MRRFVCALFLFLVTTSIYAQRVGTTFRRDSYGERPYVAAPKLAAQTAIEPAVTLPAAIESAPDQLDAIAKWNAEARTPAKNGFIRSTIDPVNVLVSPAMAMKSGVSVLGRGYIAASERGVVWSGAIKVERAYRLRLHLENASLPAGALIWVYGTGDTPVVFGAELLDDQRGLWTPSVEGDTIHLELEVPSGSTSSFVIRELVEIVRMEAAEGASDSACLVDAACVSTATVPSINTLRAATAQISYVKTGGSFVCTGGLINDRDSTRTPHFLTANHCISDQSAASSIEARWDYARSSCGGVAPSYSTATKTNGSTLLTTGASSDYTLLRLNSIPSGRGFLGWDPRSSILTSGLLLYRVSHPFPDDKAAPQPQAWTESYLDLSAGACSGVPRPRFIYATNTRGATWGGSSGSPVVYVSGNEAYVVGQLYGGCGPTGASDCDPRQANVEGAFSQTYSSIAAWIDPGSGVTPDPCVPSAKTLCLADGRFAVTASWASDSASGAGDGVKLTNDTGYFWFFQSTNVEVVVKVLNACGIGSRFWVFAGGLTNVNVVLTVKDTKNGTVKTYTNPNRSAFQPVQDTNAFATCP
jgi:V8-like Glu-specific endopeptidase